MADQPKYIIPNIFHFIFGLGPDFGNKEFCLVHYLAVKSAYVINKPKKIYLYYTYEPKQNKWWEKTKELVEMEYITPPDEVYGNKLIHVAHKADVIRLQKLIQRGGIYLDVDTICVKPFHSLRSYSFVMGEEKKQDKIKGLCNAVMLSAKGALFPQLWLETYKTFRSKGFDDFWAEHSVHIPYKLSQKIPDQEKEIHIEPYTSFFHPYYTPDGLDDMFVRNRVFQEAYCHHLWESFAYNQYFKTITPEYIKATDTTYNLLARKVL